MQFATTRLHFPNGLSKKQKKLLENWHAQFQPLDKDFLAAGVREAWITGRAADGDDLRQEGRTLFLTVDVVDRNLSIEAIERLIDDLTAAVRRGIGWPVFIGVHVGKEAPHGAFQVFFRPAA